MINNKSLILRFRFLTACMIISGALNIFFISYFIFQIIKDSPLNGVQISSRKEGAISDQKKYYKYEISNIKYLNHLGLLSYRDVLFQLSNKNLMEEGFTKRDLALGYLVTFYDFNIKKALNVKEKDFCSLQERRYIYTENEEKKEVFLFAGLYDDQYDKIIKFAMNEKWPFTAKGIFKRLVKVNAQNDSRKGFDLSLENAFIATDEFYYISNLFRQTGIEIKNKDVLKLLYECPWPFIASFVENQKNSFDFSKENRLSFLLKCLDLNSSKSAELLLTTDFIYATKRLDNNKILKMLSLLKGQTKEIEHFCVELIKSARIDIIWQKAAERLYLFSKENMPQNISQADAMEKFVLTDRLKKKWQKEEKETNLKNIILLDSDISPNIHLVREGENLWKIARLYKVDIDELIRINSLETDVIYPGLEIIIPQDR